VLTENDKPGDRRIFETATVSLWEQDLSAVKAVLDELKRDGITDLRAYFAERPGKVDELIAKIRVCDVNPATLRLFRAKTKEELSSLHTIFIPETRAVFVDELVAIGSGQPGFSAEAALKTVDGEHRYVVFNIAFPRDDPSLAHVLVTVTDVTSRSAEYKRAQQQLAEAQEVFGRFMQHLPAAAWIKDLAGRYVYANPYAENIFRTTMSDLAGRGDAEVFAPETARRFRENDQLALDSGRAVQVIETLDHEDGPHQSLVAKFPIFDHSGTAAYAGGVAIDMTDRLRAEEALRARESHLILAMNAGQMGTWEWDCKTGGVKWSPQLEAIHGLARGTFAGTFEAFQSDMHPDDRERVLKQIDAAVRDRSDYAVEYRIIRPDQQTRWIEARGQVLVDAQGQPERMAGVCMDITERQRAAEELRAANQTLQRVNQNLRQFSYAASHDLKEPLRQVALYAQLLAEDYKGKLGADGDRYVMYCVEGAQRMLDLLRDLNIYIGVDKAEDQPLGMTDPNRILEIVKRGLAAMISHSEATLTTDPLPLVLVQETHLIQLFQNLLENAIKYRAPSRPPRIHVSSEERGGTCVFSVADNGIGVDPQYHERIFEVFKRLHRDPPGTGIGLAICQKIVDQYDGKIWLESQLGAGSTFYFTLPAAPAV
jgi:PAS domain S-box-containing protein